MVGGSQSSRPTASYPAATAGDAVVPHFSATLHQSRSAASLSCGCVAAGRGHDLCLTKGPEVVVLSALWKEQQKRFLQRSECI